MVEKYFPSSLDTIYDKFGDTFFVCVVCGECHISFLMVSFTGRK